jgi:flagellar hook-associated protein 2
MPIRMSGLVSGMDTESIVKELMSAQRKKSTNLQNKKTKLEWKQEKWKELNKQIYSFYTGALSKAKMQGNYQTKKATSSNNAKVEVTAGSTAPEGVHKIQVKAVANTQYVTGTKLDSSVNSGTKLSDLGFNTDTSITVKIGNNEVKTIEFDKDATIEDFASSLREVGLNASYDTKQGRFFISAKNSGTENAFSLLASSSDEFAKLGLCNVLNVEGNVSVPAGSGVSVVKPSDAVIIYNGVELSSSSNTISVNGLNVTVKEVTKGMDTPEDLSDDETISITVNKDAQSVYDMVKNFVKSYNELLKTMNDMYYADTARGYEPLTDEQKDAMTDKEVEKWEEKIKDSLLRRDSSIGSMLNLMKTELYGSVEVNGKSYALSSFGITAMDYTEKGLLHISGDSEDTLKSTGENLLMKAIEEDPDAVMQVITTLANKLYGAMSAEMRSTKLRSALSFYNDKEMKNTIKDYEDKLKEMEKKFQEMETRYYKQFTAMEKALANLNSQSESINSLLGITSK